MDLVNTIGGVMTALAAVIGVPIAILQLRGGRRDAKAARMAQLSWQIYQAYESPELREGRRALNTVSRNKPIPQTGEQFGAKYVTGIQGGDDQRENMGNV
jgi:hypothetical protein